MLLLFTFLSTYLSIISFPGAIISVIGKAVNGLMGKEEKERINIDGDDERQLAKSTEPDDLHQVSSDEAQSCIISVGRQLSKERYEHRYSYSNIYNIYW